MGVIKCGDFVVQLVVDGCQLLVERLEFLLGGFEFFVRRLKLFVCGLQLLIRAFQLFKRRLRLLLGRPEFAFEMPDCFFCACIGSCRLALLRAGAGGCLGMPGTPLKSSDPV